MPENNFKSKEDSGEVQESNSIAAFFDLDNTILEMHTMILFARYLTKVGRVSGACVDAMLERVKLMERSAADPLPLD